MEIKDYLDVQPDEVRLMNKHFTPGRGGRKIRYVTRHHLAGVGTAKDVWSWWQTRAASAHYVVEPTGRVAQLVWDRDTAWSNANAVSNSESISIEHSNAPGADYPISDVVIIAGARLAAALCLYYGLGKPEHGKNVRDHREFGSTSCPHHLAKGGKYHDKWMSEARRFYDVLVAAKAGNATAPQPTKPAEQKPPAPQPAPAVPADKVPSLINPAVTLTLQHYRSLQDAYAWEQREAIKGIYAALGLDYDDTISKAIAADRAAKPGKHAK